MQDTSIETQTNPTPEQDTRPHTEHVSVTMLNTSFGAALNDVETLNQILPQIEPGSDGELSVVGFSEVTPGVRAGVVDAITQQGYQAVAPDGEGKNIDIIWAVSPEMQVRDSIAHRFDGSIASRSGKNHKRDVGTLVIEAVTPNGRVLRLSSERFAPPLRGERARRVHMLGMGAVLDELTAANDTTVDIDISGGDHNKAGGPTDADKRMWEAKGYTPVVADGETTYNVGAAGRTARAAGKALQILRRYPTMEFDKMYARPGQGRELIRLETDDKGDNLSSSQIGYSTAEVVWVDGTDHAAIRTMVSLPPKSGNDS